MISTTPGLLWSSQNHHCSFIPFPQGVIQCVPCVLGQISDHILMPTGPPLHSYFVPGQSDLIRCVPRTGPGSVLLIQVWTLVGQGRSCGSLGLSATQVQPQDATSQTQVYSGMFVHGRNMRPRINRPLRSCPRALHMAQVVDIQW